MFSIIHSAPFVSPSVTFLLVVKSYFAIVVTDTNEYKPINIPNYNVHSLYLSFISLIDSLQGVVVNPY